MMSDKNNSSNWRDKYTPEYTYALNPIDFETEMDLVRAISEKIKQQYEQEEKESKTTKNHNNDATKGFPKDKIYTFVGVIFTFANYHYYYLTNDDTISIGDYVVAPVGTDNKECVGKVVSVEKHLHISVPFPIEKTKWIIRKYAEPNK